MSRTQASSLPGDTGVEVDEWQSNLVSDEIAPALSDMAELEDQSIEGETALLTAKLLLEVTDGDWKQAEGIAKVIAYFFERYQSKGGETVYEE
jgi:hypothetical protein